jgi:hypothetical protein
MSVELATITPLIGGAGAERLRKPLGGGGIAIDHQAQPQVWMTRGVGAMNLPHPPGADQRNINDLRHERDPLWNACCGSARQ